MKVLLPLFISCVLVLLQGCEKKQQVEPSSNELGPVFRPDDREESKKQLVATSINITGQYLGIHEKRLYNYDDDLKPESPVSFNFIDEDGQIIEDIPSSRPQRLIDLNDEYLLLARTYYACWDESICSTYGESLPQETYLVNKKTGSLWLLPNNYYPYQDYSDNDLVKLRTNGTTDTLYMVVGGGDELEFAEVRWDEKAEGEYHLYRKTSILSIDLSDPERPLARLQSPGHLKVDQYKIDSYGNIIFLATDEKIDNQWQAYALATHPSESPRVEYLSADRLKKIGFDHPYDIISNYNDRVIEDAGYFKVVNSFSWIQIDPRDGTISENSQPVIGELRLNFDVDKDILEMKPLKTDVSNITFDHSNSYIVIGDTLNIQIIALDDMTVIASLKNILLIKDDTVHIVPIELNELISSNYIVEDGLLYFSDNSELLALDLESLLYKKFELPYKGILTQVSSIPNTLKLTLYNSANGTQAKVDFSTISETFSNLEITEGEEFSDFFELIKVDSID